MKNLKDIQNQAQTSKTTVLIEQLVLKNLKGGTIGCPPPYED